MSVNPDPKERPYVPSVETRLRDWIHETPLSLCSRGADTCPDWDLAQALSWAVYVNTDDAWAKLHRITKQVEADRVH